MNLNPQRPWITPLVIGTFALMAVTGSLMFFHLDTGLNKTAHEWLGWAMVAAVLLHPLSRNLSEVHCSGSPAVERSNTAECS